MIIIARQREALKSQQARKDLNSILKEWTFNNQPIHSAHQFLTKFRPWIKERSQEQKAVEALLQRKGVNNLSEIT